MSQCQWSSASGVVAAALLMISWIFDHDVNNIRIDSLLPSVCFGSVRACMMEVATMIFEEEEEEGSGETKMSGGFDVYG